jgi:ESS family glutamate:Na+ symporter
VILLAVTVVYMAIQNSIGVGIASIFGLPAQLGLLNGTVSLIGGHGTAVAWAPVFAERFGIANAMEIGIASATVGLVLASVMGGPVASYLIRKHSLKPTDSPGLDVGVPAGEDETKVDYVGFLRAVLALHLSITLGVVIDLFLERWGLKLPLFVSCLFAGIVLSNAVLTVLPALKWPCRSASLALIADLTLGVFLAMSLMSMQLGTVIRLAAPLISILVAQFLVAILMTVFVVFRVMGRDYNAAVVSAGFGGYSLGSTVTAMANMTAVTQRHGPSHLAFVFVPLVCAFFIDLVNAFMIQGALSFLG